MPNAHGKRRRFGSVRRLPSGRFQARYPGPDGQLRNADKTFPTQRDAEVWLVRKEAEIMEGRWQDLEGHHTARPALARRSARRWGRRADVVKACQILRAIMNTAVDDGLIERNPCRVKGAGAAKTAERPYLTVPEVYRMADKVPACFRVLVLLAAFTGLRFGELAALQRHDVDLERRTISVRRAQAETRAEGLVIKTPKATPVFGPWLFLPPSSKS